MTNMRYVGRSPEQLENHLGLPPTADEQHIRKRTRL